MRIVTLEDLQQAARAGETRLYPPRPKIVVGMSTCGRACGAAATFEALRAEAAARGMDVVVGETGCIGLCQEEPLVEVIRPARPRIAYGRVTADRIATVLDDLRNDTVTVDRALYAMYEEPTVWGNNAPATPARRYCDPSLDGAFGAVCRYERHPFFAKQLKVALRNCGFLDPTSIEEYIARGGYFAAYKALTSMTRDEILAAVSESGLRGRGGGGFPTGRKWASAAKYASPVKYVICNADEGDPGAYMDRSILEGDPHSVLEGMMIGAYAVGATIGYIYVRAEYPEAIRKLETAIAQMRECGLLGEKIFGTDFSFDIRLARGGGAFVCGESSALIASIEGKAGEPRAKHIHMAESGLWGKPTVLNNVETWNNVPVIIARGPKWFASIGTARSKGTKVFSLVGEIRRTGLVEVPMGMTLREIVGDIGGGAPAGRKFKAVQTGGPSGGCIPEALMDLPVDFDELTRVGSMMGSGGMIAMDESTCMVGVARYFTDFLIKESCGKCTPCREGLKQIGAVLDRIVAGAGRPDDLPLLERLCDAVANASLCGLGTSAPNPVLSTLRYFRDEYEAHIRRRRCPARSCKALITFSIAAEKCTGCTLCAVRCPSQAIEGEKKGAHRILADKCTQCGICREVCKFDAVIVE